MTARVSLVVPTVGRPECALRLVRSAQLALPGILIIVVDQDGGSDELGAYFRAHRLQYILMDGDPSVTRARNIGVEAVKTEYFILVDDDMVLLPDSSKAHDAVDIMDACPDVAFLGGDLQEHKPSDSLESATADDGPYRQYPKARNLYIDRTGKGLVVLPAEISRENRRSVRNKSIMICDMVPYWGIGRRSAFGSGSLGWDIRMGQPGEHYDFMLQRQKNHPAWAFAFWNELVAEHRPVRSQGYKKIRLRSDWTAFASKWDVNYIYHVGGHLRRFADFQTVVPLPEFLGARERTLLRQIENLRGALKRSQQVNERLRRNIERQILI